MEEIIESDDPCVLDDAEPLTLWMDLYRRQEGDVPAGAEVIADERHDWSHRVTATCAEWSAWAVMFGTLHGRYLGSSEF